MITMMKKGIFILVLCLMSLGLSAQSIDLSGRWFDGIVGYFCTLSEEGVYEFTGGTPHEGGYAFVLVPAGDDRYTLRAPEGMDADYTPVGHPGDKVVVTRVDGEAVLLVYGFYSDELSAIVVKKEGGKTALWDAVYDWMVQDLQDMLTGTYVDPAGHSYVFSGDNFTGAGYDGKYAFANEYDFPGNQIMLDGKHWKGFDLNVEGLKLFDIIYDSVNDLYDTSGSGLQLTADTRADGRWPWASRRLLNPSMLVSWGKANLRLMRNEIYARHGYVFQAQDLRDYFSAQPWYRPLDDNSQVELSQVETLNACLIRYLEATIEE